MLPIKLKIHGYRSYVDAEVNFAEYGPIVAITGENGAGKSSIIEMLTTALYWRNSCTDERGAGMDEAINSGCDRFRLELDFTMGDVLYTVVAGKKRGGARELRFIVDGVDQSGKIAETQRKILDVLRLSYDTFMDTVCIGQGTSSRFMDKSPNERRAVFTQLLDLHRYELYEKAAREQRRAVKAQVTDLEARVELLTGQQGDPAAIEAEDVKLAEQAAGLTDELASARADLADELAAKAQHREAVACAQAVLSTRRALTDRVERLTDRVAGLTSQLAAVPEAVGEQDFTVVDAEAERAGALADQAAAELVDVQQRLGRLRENMAAGKARRSALAEQLVTAQARVDRARTLGEGICDHCGATITAATKAAHVQTLTAAADDLAARVERINAKLAEVGAQGRALAQEAAEAQRVATEATAAQRAAEATAQQARAQARRNADLRAQLGGQLSLARSELTDAEAQLAENRRVQVTLVDEHRVFNDAALQARVTRIERTLTDVNNQRAVCAERLRLASVKADELRETRAKLRRAKAEHTDLGAVATAFGKAGIQARILANDLPAIEREVNEVITALCDGELSIQFVTQASVGKGKDEHTVDTLDIQVNDVFGSRRYASYSGGERFRIDFACHVGLARYLTRRAGATMDFLIVDEGLGSQDEAARQRFVDTIHRLGRFFRQIMCITHIDEVKDAFDAKLLVEKDPVRGSTVTLAR